MLEQSRRSENEKPGRTIIRAGYGGVAILPNTDTVNQVGVVLVREQRLAGMNIPHPEW